MLLADVPPVAVDARVHHHRLPYWPRHRTYIPASAARKMARVRWCESTGRYRIATGNGFYGAYQWTIGTARSAGFRRRPDTASPSEQDVRTYRWVYGRVIHHRYVRFGHGWTRDWPVCGYR